MVVSSARPQQAAAYKRCAVYARVSDRKQAEQNISVPDQIARARYFAETEGWEVVAIFTDPGATARDDSKRPDFRRMIAEACEPHRPYDVILVHNFSRFYRDHAWFELVKRKLKKNRVEIRSVTENVTDDFSLSILTLMDSKKSTDTARDVKRAMEANARDGFRNGGTTPYGYTLFEADKRGLRSKHHLAIREDEASVVRLVYELYQKGRGIKNIVTHLNERGYRSRKGNKWGGSTIERLLKSETYVGRSYFRPKDPDTGDTVERDQWILVPCPAIIDEATFERVQVELARRAPKVTAPRETTSPVLLGGIARCGSCGSRMHLYTGKGNRYLTCSGKLKYGRCEAGNPISIREDELNGAVLDSLVERLFTADRMIHLIAEVYAKRNSERQGVSKRVTSLRRQLADLGRKEKNLWDIAASLGLDAMTGFREKILDFEEQKNNLTRELSAQEALLASSVRLISANEANAVSEQLRGLVLSADVQLRRSFLRAFIDRVDVFRDEIRISGKAATIAEAAMGLPTPQEGRSSRF